jgi:hypothetical protein
VDYSFCLPEATQSRQHCPAKLGVICQSESAIMARRTVSNHWFVSVQALRLGHRLAPFARETKTFPTEAEAKQFAKEMLSERNKIIAGTFLNAHQPVRRIISGSELHRWIWAL